jgi:hypothetical protein
LSSAVDRLLSPDLAIDGIEEANEFEVLVALHQRPITARRAR